MVNINKWIACIICVLGSVASLYVLLEELHPFLRPAPETPEFRAEMVSYGSTFGPSSFSKYLTLRDCHTALRAIPVAQRSSAENQAFIRRCRDDAAIVVRTMPVNGFAWITKGLFEAALGEFEAFNRSFEVAQTVAPNEQWLAEWRMNGSETYLDKLTPTALAAHERDLTLLASSRAGTLTLARRYLADPGFRERVTAIVEKLPQERQRAFLRNIRWQNSAG